MKNSSFKISLLLFSGLFLFSFSPADAQGLFGKKKRNSGGTTSPAHLTSSTPSSQGEGTIFKSGQPEKVRETNYIIQDGEKVEQPMPRRKIGKLFGRRKNAPSPPMDAGAETPVFDTSAAPAPAPAPVATSPVAATTPAPAPAATTPLPAQTEPARGPRKLFSALPSLPSLPKFRKKNSQPVDTSQAQVLVNEGGVLVSPDASDEEFKVPSGRSSLANNGAAPPPRQEGDTIVYGSWDQVKAEKTSAADAIVRDMKAQEAEHRRKLAEAKKKQEEAIRKAQEEAKIRAMLQSGAGGFGGF